MDCCREFLILVQGPLFLSDPYNFSNCVEFWITSSVAKCEPKDWLPGVSLLYLLLTLLDQVTSKKVQEQFSLMCLPIYEASLLNTIKILLRKMLLAIENIYSTGVPCNILSYLHAARKNLVLKIKSLNAWVFQLSMCPWGSGSCDELMRIPLAKGAQGFLNILLILI